MLEDDEPNIGVIYILAVMLERKRILVERDVKTCDDGSILRIYEHKKSGETFLVTEPHLQLDKLEEVQMQVVELLGGGKGKGKGEGEGDKEKGREGDKETGGEGDKGNDEVGTQSDEEKKKNEHPTMNAQDSMTKEKSDPSDPSDQSNTPDGEAAKVEAASGNDA